MFYHCIIAGNNAASPSRILGVSFYINFVSSSTLLADLDASIKASIENNVLLEVLESLGNLNNCTLQNTVSFRLVL
jgi:hypothetical protein